MKGQLRIDELYAFIVLDEDGTEGVPAIGMPVSEVGGLPMMLPLMGADLARIDSLKAIIRTDPALRGLRITLAKFSQRTNVEVIDRTRDPKPSTR